MTSEVWAALLGALVGSLVGGAATWATTRDQWRRERQDRHEERITDLVLEAERLIRQDFTAQFEQRPPHGHLDSALTMLVALTARSHPAFSERLLLAKTWGDPDNPDENTPGDFIEYIGRQLDALAAWVKDPAAFRA